MTKKSKILSGQMSLFDCVKESFGNGSAPHNGSLDIRREVKLAISEDLKHAVDDRGRELSWAQVAAGMTDRLGREVTLSMITNWAAPSHPHEMPLSYFPAFIQATGGQRRTADVISRHCGLFLLPGPEALRAEIQRLEEDMTKLRSEKQKRLFFLKELEGR